MALKQLNYLYDRAPFRSMTNENETEWARKRLWDYGDGIDCAFSVVDRLSRLNGEGLLYFCAKDSPDAASAITSTMSGQEPANNSNPGIEVLAIPRSHYECALNPLDPRIVDAVLIQLDDSETNPGFIYWDAYIVQYIVGGHPQTVGESGEDYLEHGYGAIPAIRVLNSLDWSQARKPIGLGGDDLIGNLQSIGSLFREYSWTARLQRGQPWSVGQIRDAVLAPDAIIQVEPGGSFGITANSADLAGQREAILLHLEAFSRSLGLPSRTFRLDEREAASGVAIIADRADLEDDRRSREKLFRGVERHAHKLAGQIWSATEGENISGDLQSVVYRPWQVFESREFVLQKLNALMAQGAIAIEDVLRELYPDESEAEIAERIERVSTERTSKIETEEAQRERQSERDAKVAKAASPTDPLAALFGGASGNAEPATDNSGENNI
jgi:hypothetical protein